jgi:hypothetical protein
MRATVPANPRRQVVDAERNGHDQPFEIAERAVGALGKDLLARGVERLAQFGRVDRLRVMAFELDCAGHTLLLTVPNRRPAMP